MLGLPATVQTRAFIVIFDKEYTLPVASACGALMEMCFMLSVIAVKRNCSLCELLGMNANVPTDICFSFAGLMRRGGATGPHRDGWGIALYEGKGCRTFHDPKPSAHSEIARHGFFFCQIVGLDLPRLFFRFMVLTLLGV